MGKETSERLFNFIAPVYGLFYNRQKATFDTVIRNIAHELDLAAYSNILDVGCGTGALCAVLRDKGLRVTGVDTAERMLAIARQNPGNDGVTFIRANASEALPFDDKQYDVSIASYVAHGMGSEERKRLYAEMGRATRDKVILHDYNQRRRLTTTVIEWMEHGDYFHFIKNAEKEMKDCYYTAGACFSAVRVINVGENAAWYICDPF